MIKKGDIVYRIMKLPEGRNFSKYGVHEYKIDNITQTKIEATDELGHKRFYKREEFFLLGVYKSSYIAKLAIKVKLCGELEDAEANVKKAQVNLQKFYSDYPEI